MKQVTASAALKLDVPRRVIISQSIVVIAVIKISSD